MLKTFLIQFPLMDSCFLELRKIIGTRCNNPEIDDDDQLSNLPFGIRQQVLSSLDLPAISQLAQTSKLWLSELKEEDIWQNLSKRDFDETSKDINTTWLINYIMWYEMTLAVNKLNDECSYNGDEAFVKRYRGSHNDFCYSWYSTHKTCSSCEEYSKIIEDVKTQIQDKFPW